MKILTLSDLHGKKVNGVLNIEGVDLVLVLGDITTAGRVEETAERMNKLKDTYPALYAIPGNWELPESRQWLDDEGLSADQRTITHENLLIFGVGGSIPTPFDTPNEFGEEEFRDMLEGCPRPEADQRLLLCSHTPPYGACDKVFTGAHVGSKTVRAFIEEREPNLVLCGHIHEGRGKEMIGKTVVVNPGTAPRHYALIEINEAIKVELR